MEHLSHVETIQRGEKESITISIPVASFVILCAVVTCSLQPVQAGAATHHRRGSHPVSEDVQPSPEVDNRVEGEVANAKLILDNLDTDNFLASPYLVSAIYYHDDFLADFPVERSSANPEGRIVGRISKMLSLQMKADFVCLLHEVWIPEKPEESAQFVVPVDYISLGGGGRNHKDAVDLFAPEGTPVYSVSRGVVILADRDWSPDNVFSTTSRKGGNAVIVFDPDNDHFYRYCHLSTVLVSSEEIVESGQRIGNVGHTGLNASQPGHGGHLHFEANEYQNGHVRALDYVELRSMLERWPRALSEKTSPNAGRAVPASPVTHR